MASIHVHDDAPAPLIERAVDATFDELERLEAIFSTFRPSSEISAVNRGDREIADCCEEVVEVLDACTWLEHASGGAFSAHPPHRPGMIDPTGFVKGWATERAARCLVDAGLEHYYVSVGGDLLVAGSPAPGRPWHIAIADPRHAGEVAAALDLTTGAVATSGTSERGAHIWDGRPQAAPSPWLSVTVTGPRLAWADAFATTVFALGADGSRWLERFADYAAVCIDAAGQLHATAGIEWARPSSAQV